MYSALSTWSLIPTTEIMTDLQILHEKQNQRLIPPKFLQNFYKLSTKQTLQTFQAKFLEIIPLRKYTIDPSRKLLPKNPKGDGS